MGPKPNRTCPRGLERALSPAAQPDGPINSKKEKNTRRNERPVVVMNNLRNLIEMKLHEKLKINLIKQTTTKKKEPRALDGGEKVLRRAVCA